MNMDKMDEAVDQALASGFYSKYLGEAKYMSLANWESEALTDVLKSGLKADILERAGVHVCHFESPKEIKEALNTESAQKAEEYLAFNKLVAYPYPRTDLTRYKLLAPDRDKPEKKYLQPKGSYVEAYVLDEVYEVKDKPHHDVWITEGEKKTLCLIQHGAKCIGLGGVWSFQYNHELLVGDMQAFNWKGRKAYLAFDSDLYEKPSVRTALYELAFMLVARGAVAYIVSWDKSVGKGIDDYLVTKKYPDRDMAVIELRDNAKPILEFLCKEHRTEIIDALVRPRMGRQTSDIIRRVAPMIDMKVADLQKIVNTKKRGMVTEKAYKENETGNTIIMNLFRNHLGFNIPMDYLFKPVPPSNAMLCHLQPDKDEGVVEVELCHAFIVTRFIETDDGMKQVLRDATGKEITVDVALSDPGKFDKEVVAPYLGVTLPRKKVQMIIEYINEFHMENRRYISTICGREHTGWHGNMFSIPTKYDANERWMDSKLKTSLALSEDEGVALEAQKKRIKYMMTTPSGFVVLASLAAPLFRKCDVPNLVVHISGLQLSGKSCSISTCMSLYGKPSALYHSWNATSVGKEVMASRYQDLPLWVEEFEASKNAVRDFKEFVYQYITGQGRERSNKDLTLRKTSHFRGVMLCSAERDLDSVIQLGIEQDSKKLGMYRRVIELNADKHSFLFPVGDMTPRTELEIERFINEAYEESGNHFGWFGLHWVKHVEGNIAELASLYKEKRNLVLGSGGLNNTFALLLTVLHSKFMKDILSEEEISIAERNVLAIAVAHGEKNREVRDVATDFIEKMVGYLHENSGKVKGISDNTDNGTIAEIIWEPNSAMKDVFLPTTIFNKICQQYGLSHKIVLAELKRKGMLKTGSDGKRLATHHRIDGIVTTGYRLVGVIDTEMQSERAFEDAIAAINRNRLPVASRN